MIPNIFCTKCGSIVPYGANFCTSCGAGVDPAHLSSADAPPPPRPQSIVFPEGSGSGEPAPTHQDICPWCASPVPAGSALSSCPFCGAALRVRSRPSVTGWLELPPRKDMAKLQFGNSSCQIEGLYVPVADMNLAAEDSVYFSHHVLLWMDTGVNITTMPLRGGWKRLFAGMPLIMAQARGPGHIAFSKDEPGELIALPLQSGQQVDVREHMFLAATSNIEYDWFQSYVWYRVGQGNDSETHYPLGMFMDRFTAPALPGLLLLHGRGSVLVRKLGNYERILVKPTALIFKDPSVQMELHFEQPNAGFFGWGSWTNRAIWLRLTGPGRVAIQSVFDRVEQEGGNITSHSYATIQRW